MSHRSTVARWAAPFLMIPVLAWTLGPGSALADTPERGTGLNKRVNLSLGGFRANVDSNIRMDSSAGILGTELDFEDDLGLAERKTLPYLDLTWRLSPRNRLEFSYYKLERRGDSTLSATIRFGDEVFTASTDVESELNTTIYRAAYGFSFVHNQKAELGLLLGVHVTDIGLSIRSADGLVSEAGEATAVLPAVGLQGAIAFTPRFRLRGWGQLLKVNLSDFEGNISNYAAVLEHDTFQHLGFGIGYAYFGVDLDAEADEFSGKARYSFQGPTAFLNAWF